MAKILNFKKGYTLVEMLIYIGLFIVMSAVIVAIIMSIFETNRQVLPINSISRAAVSSLEVITREIRSAKGIDTVNSIFENPVGSLQLNTIDINNKPRVVKYYLASSTIRIDENGSYLGPLSPAEAAVTSLIFTLATSTKGNLITIEMDVTAGAGKYQKSEKFYSSIKTRIDN